MGSAIYHGEGKAISIAKQYENEWNLQCLFLVFDKCLLMRIENYKIPMSGLFYGVISSK